MTVRRFSQLFSITLFAGAAAMVQAATADQICGTWSPDNGKESKIEITQCAGGHYCGAIIWMRLPHNDDRNVDPAQRKRPLVATRIIDNFKFDGGTSWSGKFYSAQQGKNVEAKFVLLNKNELEIHDGASKTPVIWKRVAE